MSALSSDLFTQLATQLAWLVPTSVFIAGLIGSPHCVAMCGPLVMSFGRERKTLVTYHLGRMFVYTLVGALAGSVGQVALRSPSKALSAASLGLLAILLFAFAWRERRSGGSPRHFPLPKFSGSAHARIWSTVRALKPPPTTMSFIAGSLTVFLPCLHLYAFVAGAAATGSSAAGATFMFVFWLSTVPALSAAPFFIKRFFGGGSSVASKRWATGFLLTAALISLGQFAFRLNEVSTANPPAQHEHHHAPVQEHHH